MKRNLKFIILIIICLSFTGCNKKTGQKEEDTKYEDVYAITEEYDAIFRNTTYYENYKIDEKTGYIIGYDKYTISKSGNKGAKHSYEITYDNKGNKIREIESAGRVITRTYTYNEDNTINTFTYKSSEDNKEQVTIYSYEYDDKNRVYKETETEQIEDGDEITYTYEYYDNDQIKSKYYQNDDYYLNYEYTYDENGKKLTETQTSKNSIYKIEYEYDDNGYESKRKVYKDGSAIVTYTDTSKYEVVGKKILKD